MTLKQWIEKTGQKKVAKLLGVDPSTVSLWKSGKVLPRNKSLLKIRVMSGYKVSIEEIVKSTTK